MSTEPSDADVTELRELMRATGMLPPVPERLTGDVEAREQLLARIIAEATAPTPVTTAVPPLAPVTPITTARRGEVLRRATRSRHRVLRLAAAGAFVLVAILGTQLSSGHQALAGPPAALSFSGGDASDVVAGEVPSAASTLTALATAARSAPGAPRSGDVQRVTTYSWLLDMDGDSGTVVTVPTQGKWWLAPDGSIRSTQLRTAPVGPDGLIDSSADLPNAGPTATDTFPAGSLDASLPGRLPRDPSALSTELVDLFGLPTCKQDVTARATCLFTAANELFSHYVIPGDLASALWEALAVQPGVMDLGTTTDRFGRPGAAVAIAPTTGTKGLVVVLIISPADGQLLGTETLTASGSDGDNLRSNMTGFTAWNPSTWVAAVGD